MGKVERRSSLEEREGSNIWLQSIFCCCSFLFIYFLFMPSPTKSRRHHVFRLSVRLCVRDRFSLRRFLRTAEGI